MTDNPFWCATCQTLYEDKCTCKTADVSDSPGSTSYVDKLLNGLKKRLEKAGEKGRGCRVTAEEAYYLQFNNLPSTAEDLCVRDS